MSDIKKWMRLVESSENRIADVPEKSVRFKKDATVTVSPKAGGGVGRFVEYEGDGSAMIDIKGIMRKLSAEDFSAPARDYEDPYIKGNDWFHVSQEPDTVGTLKDKPEFRPGDMVKIADVYGAVIGPGYGIFIAYGTTGQDCIISFDNKEIVVPTANVAAVLEQNAKDNFGEMDNDGNLSPMSLGSENVKVEEPAMDQRDEFSKWMSAVEEALDSEGKAELAEGMPGEECGCCKWDCPACFPEQDVHPGENAMPHGEVPPEVIVVAAEPEMGGGACPNCGAPHDDMDCDMGMEEVPMEPKMDDGMGLDFGGLEEDDPMPEVPAHEKSRSGKGVKLGDIVQKFVPSGEDHSDSPLTYGEDNLGEEGFENDPGQDFASPQEGQMEWQEQQTMIDQILNLQNTGISQCQQPYTQKQLETLPFEEVKKIHGEATGNPGVAEDNTQLAGQQDMLAPAMGSMQQPQGQPTMENIDQDIQTWLSRFKDYDKLRASKAPVMEKKAKPDFLDVDKDGDKKESFKKAEKDKEAVKEDDESGKNPWEKLASGDKDDKKEKVGDSHKTAKGGTVTKTDKGLKHVKESAEEADAEVLDWMKRFSKLGNMKGYGR